MRKWQQKQILDLIYTLKQVQSSNLYADAQDGAIALGEFIESITGEDTKTVGLLEEYCELLFKASNGEIGKKVLRKQLIKIENYVRDELKPDKMEIVFFPYQLSMFDAFESIYLAAKADPDCDVYCVPIPWYVRNTDGSFGEMHYDGDQYPENIIVSNWRKYDIENRHPDVVFVHNPFDDRNFVSSIHPDFYVGRLRKNTDLLCYIAYFLPTNLDGSCGLPKAQHTMAYQADLFIAQSEAEKQRYLQARPKSPVVALGSPKIDRVINSAKEVCVPEVWTTMIPEIGIKKIIFLNSSLTYLLRFNEQYLERLLEYITAIISRPEFVLVWRPHPLMLPTLKSMRPSLLNQYNLLVDIVQKSPQAIFDDSSSFLEAMLSSYAYVGDTGSSIARLYTITGKPMFTTVMNRVSHRDELMGGRYIYDYPETDELTINVFLNKLLSSEIPSYSQEQVDLQKTIYPHCDGTAGYHIYQYIKKYF